MLTKIEIRKWINKLYWQIPSNCLEAKQTLRELEEFLLTKVNETNQTNHMKG